MKTREHNFITYLETLTEDRGALASLRRGLGQPPGTVPEMFRYVVPMLPKDAYPGSWIERTYYLVSALYALHPANVSEGNLGHHFAANLDPDPERNSAIERRFMALLTAHPDDLHIYLRQSISFLKSKEEKGRVNWHQLMWDVMYLGNPDSATRVQKQWANAFWRRTASSSSSDSTTLE